ncbi:MAG: phosphoribosylamine--glycine ligase [Acidimicrobiales bacterium]|nr:phosphoribosylamine--glycine ligase [Acidimicrobiales bacterium]
MKVCVVGNGAREHVLADVLGRTAEVVVTPGNPLVPGSTDAPPESIDADLFVVGPEAPLVDGLADRLRAQGKLVFGPGADGAHLEGSKAWMKELVAGADVPTARHRTFADRAGAEAFLDTLGDLYVIKTDGLAAGKGVLVTADRAEASEAVAGYLSGDRFGDAGRTVVIEEGMTGPELSLLAVCDGRRAVPLAPAQDYKRAFDDDRGPNTGGMGAYSPVPIVDDDLVGTIMDRFVEPTLAVLRDRGIDYRGVLYAGLMLTPEGPKLVEYNVRFGDPEAQVVLPRYAGDLAALLAEAASGELATEPAFVDDAAVTVVAATEGYPTSPRTGDRIEGIDQAGAMDGISIYGAGVARDDDGHLITAGGRVLSVTALAPTLTEARARAYDAADAISWPGKHARRDIALGAVAGAVVASDG